MPYSDVTGASEWSNRLNDQRGKKVIFLAHCLLNENTRYLGGAQRAGSISEIIKPCLENDIGIVQLPCPEQHAWGGVLKRRLLLFYGSEGTLRYRLRRVLLPLALWYTKRVYRRLARAIADSIQDYQRSGIKVIGIVGVDSSPSCGVFKTLNMAQALEKLGQLAKNSANAEDVNRIVISTVIAGQGLYIELLRQELHKRGINIALTAHDIIGELEGKQTSANVNALINGSIHDPQ